MNKNEPAMFLRSKIFPDDNENVRSIAVSSGFFRDDEVIVAVELLEEAFIKGNESGYHFLFADMHGAAVGFCCFGPIPCTIGSFDLYWIAVRDEYRRQGIGHSLLLASEAQVREMGGRKLYIETSGLPRYQPTRAFYLRAGYREEARLADFYQPGDDKLIFVKHL